MLKEKLKGIFQKKEGQTNKRKIENLVVFLIILIITVIIINSIWNDNNTQKDNDSLNEKNKRLATENLENYKSIDENKDNITKELEEILESIKGVGKVKVMLTYARTSQIVPIYNEDLTEKNTEETDQSGGTRKITETDTNKEVVYKEENGEKVPITQSTVKPQIEGAIITAEGAKNAEIKTNIVQAVEAVTGLATHKVQVFEMKDERS